MFVSGVRISVRRSFARATSTIDDCRPVVPRNVNETVAFSAPGLTIASRVVKNAFTAPSAR